MAQNIVVLVPAHNEEGAIEATLQSLTQQERRPDRVVVVIDNCTDRTLARARNVAGVTIFKTKNNTQKKPGALNQAWRRYCREADLVVCIDADTVLEPTAIGDWEDEFDATPRLGGCSGKFTMLVSDDMTRSQRLLVRVQRAEFAKWTDLALRRGRRTNVLAGTACCMRNRALRQIAAWRRREGTGSGPWIATSVVEDFELTYRMRQRGWQTKVSATVRAYTGAMTDLKSLWAQRMKWQSGTVADLLHFGVNRLTVFDWWQQLQGFIAIGVRMVWAALVVGAVVTGTFVVHPLWLLPPVIFVANDVKHAMRIPLRQPADVLVAGLLFPQECFAWMRAAWFSVSWLEALVAKPLGIQRDRWALQARAESRSSVTQPAAL